MTAIALRARRFLRDLPLLRFLRGQWMALALAAFLGAVVAVPGLREAALTSLADAYFSVSVFVALTLAIFYGLESGLKIDLGEVLRRHKSWQVPIAAILGATPGCGAEILLVTQYTRGVVSFGAIVATLTSTMGDSAFLIIAKDPPAAGIVIGLCTVAGIIVGYVVNYFHPNGLGVLNKEIEANLGCKIPPAEDVKPGLLTRLAEQLWLVIFVPGLAIGVLDLFQVDANEWFGAYAAYNPVQWLGVAGALLALSMFLVRRGRNSHAGVDPRQTLGLPPVRRMIVDTNFVTFWVFLALFGYEIVAYLTGGGVQNWLQGSQVLLPLVATMVGLIPGCGVMVLTTTLYLQSQIPLSALLAAAVSTDGDALFPAIALAPRSAVLATLYTAAPALIMGYGWYFIME